MRAALQSGGLKESQTRVIVSQQLNTLEGKESGIVAFGEPQEVVFRTSGGSVQNLRRKSSEPQEEEFRTSGGSVQDLRRKSSGPQEEEFRTSGGSVQNLRR
jgi:hypothetical protein